MHIDQIEIHAGPVDFEYEPVREVEAKCEARTAFSKNPSIVDVNARLQQMAASIGADAVINVRYDSGVSLTSWNSMKGTGLAVKRVADDIACPVCAEQIKRAAKRCRFCGADFTAGDSGALVAKGDPGASRLPAQRSSPAAPRTAVNRPHQEPLRSTDNPQMGIWLAIGAVVVVAVLLALFSS